MISHSPLTSFGVHDHSTLSNQFLFMALHHGQLHSLRHRFSEIVILFVCSIHIQVSVRYFASHSDVYELLSVCLFLFITYPRLSVKESEMLE